MLYQLSYYRICGARHALPDCKYTKFRVIPNLRPTFFIPPHERTTRMPTYKRCATRHPPSTVTGPAAANRHCNTTVYRHSLSANRHSPYVNHHRPSANLGRPYPATDIDRTIAKRLRQTQLDTTHLHRPDRCNTSHRLGRTGLGPRRRPFMAHLRTSAEKRPARKCIVLNAKGCPAASGTAHMMPAAMRRQRQSIFSTARNADCGT